VPATVWIIFTRNLNILVASQYNCLLHYAGIETMVYNVILKYHLVFALSGLGDDNDVLRVKRGR